MRRLAAIAIALALFASTSLFALNLKFLSSIEAIQMDRGGEQLENMCSTSSIGDREWITEAHCVEAWDDDGPTNQLDDNPRYIGGEVVRVVKYDHDTDLALLETPNYSLPALHISKHGPKVGDKLVVAGHPFGLEPIFVTFGFVSNPHADLWGGQWMIYDVSGAPGNSGSAVLNNHNELVSILQFGWSRSFSPVTGGATWEALRAFLK